MKRVRWMSQAAPFLIATILPLALYVYTGAPSVTLIDFGEFVTALRTLGIPHPPGVPTYVLLGHLFTLLPLSSDMAHRTNLFSAVCAALAAGVSYRITRELLPDLDPLMALAGALSFGFSLSLWSWGVVTEVYALNILLLSLLFLLAADGRWAWTALVAGLALVWTTGLAGPDIAGYYLPLFLTGSWCFAVGAAALAAWLRGWNRKPVLTLIFAGVVATVPWHFSENNHHDDRVAWLFVENSLRGVEPGSLILTSDWNFYAPWLGRRYGDDLRPDVVVLDTNMLHHAWYLPTFQRLYPDLARSAANEIAAYGPLLDRREHGEPVEGSAIDGAFTAMMETIIQSKLYAGAQVYHTLKLQGDFLPGARKAPHGLLYRYGEGAEDVPLDLSGLLPIDEGPDLGESGDLVRKNYASMLTVRGGYLANVGNFAGAREKLELALRLDPGHASALKVLHAMPAR